MTGQASIGPTSMVQGGQLSLAEALEARERAGKRVRVGVIGCGQMGTDLFVQIAQMQGIEIVAACDMRPERIEAACKMSGGEAKPLTTGVAWDMQPRYSPDGRFLAFTSDRGGGDNLWVLDTQADGGDAPPLLRIALNHGDLHAMLKPDNDGERTDSVVLKKGVGANWFKVGITVKNSTLTVTVDGQQKLTRSLAYWKFPNYFKAGCYPQAVKGTADIFFRKLSVN